MIDIASTQLYEPLPESKVLNSQNLSITEENKMLKKVIVAMAIGIIIYWGYKLFMANKMRRDED